MARMRVNGQALEFALDPATPLLWALRDAANLTGTKQGCGGTGECGACTVIVDGGAVLSCKVAIASLEGADVTTVEGLAGHPLTLALVAEDAIGCGFCLPGFTCGAAALLQQSARPAAEQVDALPTRCACGLQPRLRRAVERAAGAMAANAQPAQQPAQPQQPAASSQQPPAPSQIPEIVTPPR